MRDRFIPALITLIAGAVTCIIDIYHKSDLLSSLKRLLLVLIIFYVIGLIAKAIINKVLIYKPSIPDKDTYDKSEDKDNNNDKVAIMEKEDAANS